MITWPPSSELPQRVLKDGFQFVLPDGRMASEMDRGPDKLRGDVAGSDNPVQCQIEINTAQLARWRRFWQEDLGGGNLWFLIRDQQFDGQIIEGLADNDSEETTGTYYWLARPTRQTPAESPMGGGWYRVAFQLQVMVPP